MNIADRDPRVDVPIGVPGTASRRITWALALALTVLCVTGARAGVNKCKDKNGTVIYSEQPCEQAGAARIKELSKADLKGNDVRAKVPPPPAPGELAPLPVPPLPPGTAPRPNRD